MCFLGFLEKLAASSVSIIRSSYRPSHPPALSLSLPALSPDVLDPCFRLESSSFTALIHVFLGMCLSIVRHLKYF